MSEIISKTLKIKAQTFPPTVEYIEEEITKNGLEPLRWAIVDVDENTLVLAVSGRKI